MAAVEARASIFDSRSFRQYFAGQSLSLLGDGLRALAIPLLAYHLTHSALSTAAAFVAQVLPFTLFATIGGSLADRIDRKTLMIAADAVRCAVLVFFAFAYWRGFLTMPSIYAGLVVISIATAAFLGGQTPSLPYLLGRDRATEATAALTGAESVCNLIAPIVGGAIFTLFGPLPALVINAITYLGSQISLSRIDSLGPDNPHGMPSLGHLIDDTRVGFVTLFSDVGMRTQALLAFGLNIFGFGAYAILIPFLKRDFAATDQQVGVFLGIAAVGALAGSAFTARNGNRWPFGRAITVAYLVDALVFLPIPYLRSLWAVSALWAVSNALMMFEFSQIVGFRVRVAPEHLLGRVMGAVRVFVLAGMAPGVFLFGWIADHQGTREAMWISALGYVALAVLALCMPAIRDETR